MNPTTIIIRDPNRTPSEKVVDISTLAVIWKGRIMLVRKRGQDFLILPGGKPEASDNGDTHTTMQREVLEELGTGVHHTSYVATFLDAAGGEPGVDVRVTLYRGWLDRQPRPQAEIEDVVWTPIVGSKDALAPSLTNLILPHLAKLENLS